MTTLGNVNVLTRLKAFAGLDIHLLGTVLFRGWGSLAGVVTIILLPLFLSPMEQGLYFTFESVLALQVFFKLGLNYVLTQLAGHKAAHLHRADDGSLQGDLRWRRKVVSVIALSNKWNTIMARGSGALRTRHHPRTPQTGTSRTDETGRGYCSDSPLVQATDRLKVMSMHPLPASLIRRPSPSLRKTNQRWSFPFLQSRQPNHLITKEPVWAPNAFNESSNHGLVTDRCDE